jgi:hypothetical protein
MPHRWSIILVFVCFAALFLSCFFPVLFQDRQFGFRDSAHYYYPLYERVQQEWGAGRVPLWEMEENAGMPLLGNPTAAVLYPLKVIYALVPYAWGARLYTVVHTALAFAAMLVLMRSWGTSWTGSGLSALAYAFGAPVLFQYCNIIYLVGAAWLPLGVHAVDRWVRCGRRWGLLELAVVLAMQTLGGEPQSAYLLGLAGVGYAAGLAWHRAAARRKSAEADNGPASRSRRNWQIALVVAHIVAIWIVATLVLGSWVPQFRVHEKPPKPLPWMSCVPTVVNFAWGIVAGIVWRSLRPRGWLAATGVWLPIAWVIASLALAIWVPEFRLPQSPIRSLPWLQYLPQVVNFVSGFAIGSIWRSFRRPVPGSFFGSCCLGLAGAAAFAIALSAVQFFPVVEFTQQTIRAAEAGTHEIYPFSVEPIRLAGLIWPDVLGSAINENTSWGDLVRLPGSTPRVWVPSLYLGGVTIVLALGYLSMRRGAPWRIWLSVIVLVSAVGSLGLYTSPIWAARAIAEGKRPGPTKPGYQVNDATLDESRIWPPMLPLIRRLGPLDPEESTPIRLDDYLRDGDGGIYWLMSTFLPGFRQFRFPAKLFTFTSLGLAALAGLGWDAVGRGGSRRATAVIAALLGITVTLLAGVLAYRAPVLASLRSAHAISLYGPFHPVGAYAALVGGLLQGTIVIGLGLVAVRLAARRPRLAGLLVLSLTTADLIMANRHYVLTVPQSEFETTPEVLRIIRDAERADPAPGPYRVHRLPAWDPIAWGKSTSPDRGREIVRWERDTLQPKYGIPFGLEYAHVVGVAELYELEWYYGGFPWPVRDKDMARALNIGVGDRVVYYPRRTFDMWNARYFIVPAWPAGWMDAFRGYAAMLIDSETIFPPLREFTGPGGEDRQRDWFERNDYRILRNRRDHPRAWVVHEARTIEVAHGLRADLERQRSMKEITFENDAIWHNPDLQAFDPHRVVWIDSDQRSALAPYLPGGPQRQSEAVRLSYPSPQQVELDVTMESKGVVVLADIAYPGWELTVDGKPAPIYRVNRAMRGAALDKGPHHLVYTYAPRSYRVGRIVSVAALVAMALAALACWLRPVEPAIARASSSSTEGGLAHD